MSYAIKSYINVNVDESIVANKLKEEIKNCNIYVPHKDMGIDLILIKPNKPTKAIRIQVKGSKLHYNPKRGITDPDSKGWFTLSKTKLEKYSKILDYMIFIVHNIEINSKNKPIFIPFYIIIPPNKLLELAKKNKKVNSKKDYNFVFIKNKDKVTDSRDEIYDLTKYCNNWRSIK